MVTFRHHSGSRPISDNDLSLVNSTYGSKDKPCLECRKVARDTKEVVCNGLLIVRLRFGLPFSELPDQNPDRLTRFLSYLLLQGQARAPVVFPRRQAHRGIDGLCDLQRLCRRERWELAHSVASIKRNLPPSCKRHTPTQRPVWENRAFNPPPPPSSEYLSFVRRETLRMFRRGWDSQYENFVYSHVPNASSRKSGERSDLSWKGRRRNFLGSCLGGAFDTSPLRARYKEVPTAGKVRPLLIFDDRVDLLGPLHKMIYHHLERTQEWLLVGPPTEKKISSVCTGKVNTSVDLVSATDNLSLPVTDAILSAILSGCAKVPGAVRLLALNSLYPVVDGGDEPFCYDSDPRPQVLHGQMMGGYLSFPLLCLNSYLAARWAARTDPQARFLVNGDDTIISSCSAVPASAYPEGFRLNDTKTIRAEAVVEVNSTVFLLERGRWREIHHLRRGGALSDFAGVCHMALSVSKGAKWTDAFIRSRIGKGWGLMPSQLGLLANGSYSAFVRDREMRKRRVCTDLPVRRCGDSLLLQVLGEPDPDHINALIEHQWIHGREGGRKRDEFHPSRGEVRRSFTYVRSSKPAYSKLTYRCHLRALRLSKGRERKTYSVPDLYVDRRYDEAMKDLMVIRDSMVT
jgi:hypothetical protein